LALRPIGWPFVTEPGHGQQVGLFFVVVWGETGRGSSLRYTWAQHQQAARTLAQSPTQCRGTALALMGIALLLLIQDLDEAG